MSNNFYLFFKEPGDKGNNYCIKSFLFNKLWGERRHFKVKLKSYLKYLQSFLWDWAMWCLLPGNILDMQIIPALNSMAVSEITLRTLENCFFGLHQHSGEHRHPPQAHRQYWVTTSTEKCGFCPANNAQAGPVETPEIIAMTCRTILEMFLGWKGSIKASVHRKC